MITKDELVAQYRLEYPILVKTFDGANIELTAEEYEETLNIWADAEIEAQTMEAAKVAESEAKIAARESALAKLAALGLTEDEASAISA